MCNQWIDVMGSITQYLCHPKAVGLMLCFICAVMLVHAMSFWWHYWRSLKVFCCELCSAITTTILGHDLCACLLCTSTDHSLFQQGEQPHLQTKNPTVQSFQSALQLVFNHISFWQLNQRQSVPRCWIHPALECAKHKLTDELLPFFLSTTGYDKVSVLKV